jgi:hypothetical protein
MKKLLIIFLLAFGTVAFSQSREHIIVDTLDYVQFDIVNWELHFGPTTDSTTSICEIDTTSSWGVAGSFTSYLISSNTILKEGMFEVRDSVECKECYRSKYENSKFNYVDVAVPTPKGEWKFYFSSGKLKSRGSFSNKVHQYVDSNCPMYYDTIPGQRLPIPRALGTIFLKHGTWEYYNEKGENHKTEEYIEGVLIDRMTKYRTINN